LLHPLERLIAFAASDDPTDTDDLDYYLNLIADPVQSLSQIADHVTLTSIFHEAGFLMVQG